VRDAVTLVGCDWKLVRLIKETKKIKEEKSNEKEMKEKEGKVEGKLKVES